MYPGCRSAFAIIINISCLPFSELQNDNGHSHSKTLIYAHDYLTTTKNVLSFTENINYVV